MDKSQKVGVNSSNSSFYPQLPMKNDNLSIKKADFEQKKYEDRKSQKIDFEKRNLENLKKLSEKKARALVDMEDSLKKKRENKNSGALFPLKKEVGTDKLFFSPILSSSKGTDNYQSPQIKKVNSKVMGNNLMSPPQISAIKRKARELHSSTLSNGFQIRQESCDSKKGVAERILQRQQKYLQQLEEKKEKIKKKAMEEARKKQEEEKKWAANKKAYVASIPNPKLDSPGPKTECNFLTKHSGLPKPSKQKINDLSLWKKANNIHAGAKIFIIQGGYDDIRQALLKRGWVENTDCTSTCFDLKWALRGTDIDYENLLKPQIVNHYENNKNITTKIGLSHSLRKLIWFNNVDIDTFYPRSFDLIESSDKKDFIEDYKTVKAENVLKQFIFDKQNVVEAKLLIALNVCLKRVEDSLDDPAIEDGLITAEEWDVLNTEKISSQILEKIKQEAWYIRILRKFWKYSNNGKREISQNLVEKIKGTLEELRHHFPQFDLNGTHNIWIIKPAGLSRGRGIMILNNFNEIMHYANCIQHQYIIQKYIENPLIIMNRKFDLRQWVVVTNWNPLTVWFYEECYVRFGAIEYDIHEIKNQFMHLTNNSITKHYEGSHSEIEGNMWEQSGLVAWMKV